MDIQNMDLLETQIETRTKLDSAMTDEAYATLASSVSVSGHVPPAVGDETAQTEVAVRACLRHCGVEAKSVPGEVSDPDDRLDYLCRSTGVMRRDVRLEGTWYKSSFGAMLAHLDTGEAVALLPRGMGSYAYVDPTTGKRVRVNKSTAQHIEQEAVYFYRPLPTRPIGVRDMLTFALSSFELGDYLLVLVAALVATLVGLLPAWANQVVFSVVVPSGQEGLIAPLAALLLGVAISTVLIGICRNLVIERVTLKVEVVTEAASFARMLSLPTEFFKKYSGGELGQRISQIPMLIQQLSSMLLGSGLTIVLSLTYLVQIGLYTPTLVVPALLVMTAQLVSTVVYMFLWARYDSKTMTLSAKLSGDVTTLLGGIQKIKLAGAEDRAFAKWATGYADYARSAYNRPVIVRVLPAIGILVGSLGAVAIYASAGAAHVTPADYMSFSVAYGQLTAGLSALMGMAMQVAQFKPMLDMVRPILEATPELADDKPNVGSLTGAIEVSNVSFRYGPDDPFVLKDLSFKVLPGEYVALVGKSGCGKSTILRLLLGFEQPERGSITFGPHDASKVNVGSLRRHIGVVTQNGRLFMGDIASNIRISATTATLDDVWEAAELAGIADDIRKMPMGMQTMVTEGGGGISGGQRQRIMIARAVCGNKRILMFDEATSALDNKAQRHVSESLDGLNCTRVVIAHRLSTVRHCDRIMVVDDGRIAEQGTYEELIERGGLFAELVARQRLDEEGR